MSQQPAIPPHSTHVLAAGEPLLLQARTGTRLVIEAGMIVLFWPPVWLGEQVVRASTPLEAGQSQVIDQRGWITLSGGSRGGTVCVVQPQPTTGWASVAGRLWRGLAVFAGLARA